MHIRNLTREFIVEEDRAFDSAHASTLVQTADAPGVLPMTQACPTITAASIW